MELEEILAYADELKAEYNRVETSTPYAKTKAKIEKLEDKISKMEEQIEVLKARAEKQSRKHYDLLDTIPSGYYKDRVRLIGEELLRRNPQFKSYYTMGVFGLNGECSLWFYEDELGYTQDLKRIRATLDFQYGGKNGIVVWTGETTNEYPKGSIGEMNGGNNVMIDVTSIDQLNEMLKASYEKHLKDMEETKE